MSVSWVNLFGQQQQQWRRI